MKPVSSRASVARQWGHSFYTGQQWLTPLPHWASNIEFLYFCLFLFKIKVNLWAPDLFSGCHSRGSFSPPKDCAQLGKSLGYPMPHKNVLCCLIFSAWWFYYFWADLAVAKGSGLTSRVVFYLFLSLWSLLSLSVSFKALLSLLQYLSL
jgi:hypothetical protein